MVLGRGADLAAHAARSILSYASQMNWSVRMVFVDLSNAFDKIVRELVVGWPDHLPASRDVRVNYRTSMGVSCRAASHTHAYLQENGCLFEQWGVDELCTVLLRTLHVGSWFFCGSDVCCELRSWWTPRLQSGSYNVQWCIRHSLGHHQIYS